MIGIIDIGLSNIASVQRIVEKSGGKATFIQTPRQIRNVKKIILPGVGNFKTGMEKLANCDLISALTDVVKSKEVVLLGICLGMQLLCRFSEEGRASGLGFVGADVKKITFKDENKLKIPHMGWNIVNPVRANDLIPIQSEEQRFYFVHSYKVVPDDPNIVTASANYGQSFCAAFQVGNVFGVQFHPEKSHQFGKALFKRFLEL